MKYLTLESYDTHQPTNCIKLSHSDAKCFDVDKKDRVIIGGKNEILIINLNENNSEQLLKSKSIKRWGISHVKWSTTNKDIFCYVVYDKAHIAQIKDCIEKLYVLSNHNRQISDVDWSKVDPNIVLTASSDTFINIWDIRTNAKPTIVLKSVEGASLAKWHHSSMYTLCSSHGSIIRIWDLKMPKKPVNYIVAHLKEINTLDWSNVEADNLMSASCEKSIKFWSINQDVQNPMYTYEANFRTVRAKYTPMKSKVMAICSDFNDSLYKVKLFDIENYSKKFHSFDDNRSAIDFFCCKKGEDEISCLILSKDKILRLYNMKECLFKDESIDVHDQIKSKKHSSLVKCDSITESKFQSIDTGSVSNGTTKSPISHEKNSLSDEYDYDEELFENSKHIYSSVKLPTNTSDILLNSPKLSMAIFTLKGSLVIMNGNVQNRKFNKGLEKNLKKTSNYSINFSFEKKPIPDFDADATDSSSSACKEYKKDFKGFDRKPINYQNSNNKIVKDLLCSKKRKKYRSKSKYFIYVYDYSKLFLYKHELTENYVYEVHDLGSACQKNKIITQGLYESNMWDDFSILFKSHSYKTISDCKTQWMTQPLLIYEFIYYLEYFVSKNKIETFVAMSPIFFLIKNALYNISNHKDIFPKPYIFMNMYIEKTFIKRILSWELNAKVEFYVYLYSDILRSSGFINQATSLLHFINNYPKSCALVKKQNFTKNLMCIICETNIKELYTYCNKCRTVCHTWHLVENIDNIVCLYCHCLNLYKLNN